MPNVDCCSIILHSVCYIAGELVKKLQQDLLISTGSPDLINVMDVLCVQIAALCHDLGMYENDALYLQFVCSNAIEVHMYNPH